jgi:hypothetical protein
MQQNIMYSPYKHSYLITKLKGGLHIRRINQATYIYDTC